MSAFTISMTAPPQGGDPGAGDGGALRGRDRNAAFYRALAAMSPEPVLSKIAAAISTDERS
jgi:hypothetical protein